MSKKAKGVAPATEQTPSIKDPSSVPRSIPSLSSLIEPDTYTWVNSTDFVVSKTQDELGFKVDAYYRSELRRKLEDVLDNADLRDHMVLIRAIDYWNEQHGDDKIQHGALLQSLASAMGITVLSEAAIAAKRQSSMFASARYRAQTAGIKFIDDEDSVAPGQGSENASERSDTEKEEENSRIRYTLDSFNAYGTIEQIDGITLPEFDALKQHLARMRGQAPTPTFAKPVSSDDAAKFRELRVERLRGNFNDFIERSSFQDVILLSEVLETHEMNYLEGHDLVLASAMLQTIRGGQINEYVRVPQNRLREVQEYVRSIGAIATDEAVEQDFRAEYSATEAGLELEYDAPGILTRLSAFLRADHYDGHGETPVEHLIIRLIEHYRRGNASARKVETAIEEYHALTEMKTPAAGEFLRHNPTQCQRTQEVA